MKKVSFFCDFCGVEVSRDERVCPSCGKTFSAVRCPKCGNTGPVRAFSSGCPRCGYTAHAPAGEAAKKSIPAPQAERPLGALGWAIVIFLCLSSLAALAFSVLR